MSPSTKTLGFHDAAWAAARDLAAAGRRAAALAALAPLLGSPDTPPRLVLLARRLAARAHAAAGRHRAARRELYAAEKLAGTNAEVQYELGLLFEQDPYGCDRRAARRFKKALALAPGRARYAAALGRALVRLNRVNAGVAHLRAAADAAPADVGVLAVVVDGLCDAGRADLAASVATKARFLRPADRAVRRLGDQARYAAALPAKPSARPTGPKLLQYVSAAVVGLPAGTGGVIRRDAGARPAPHLGRLRAYRAGQA